MEKVFDINKRIEGGYIHTYDHYKEILSSPLCTLHAIHTICGEETTRMNRFACHHHHPPSPIEDTQFTQVPNKNKSTPKTHPS